ncbi:MAG: hypothetical protein M0Z44_03960 [Gammaproteobacteria bacterium]|nr:hypothetical protein [Gammaproteobacteria bacterium]
MSIKTLLLAAGLAVATVAPAFAATHNIRADRAALAAARVDLHKAVVARAHARHVLYVALHQHKPKLAAQARHNIAVDNAAIHRDVLAIHRARFDLHRDYVAMHHPVMHPATHS